MDSEDSNDTSIPEGSIPERFRETSGSVPERRTLDSSFISTYLLPSPENEERIPVEEFIKDRITRETLIPSSNERILEQINSQLEHLQAKYVGTGHADLNRFEWAVNIQRDSYASYVGHYPLLAYFAVAENESIGRERYNFMQKMLLPCGYPPKKEEAVNFASFPD
ncbi:hypothetical protein KP509_31G018500 [Ceratopteris richardii]|uniref:Splicing factor subunit n=1 Tax=Ceratopteris richardii TaxID=49495 RepID=A0A8T2QXT5_CERRI|nr:hypothetical protein KP509_31G018500 [Ceratopteris richardii]